MKSLVITTILAFFSSAAYAATQTFDFTYAGASANDLSAVGSKTTGAVDVAMRIDNPALKGMKLTSIKAYINTTTDISNTSVWLSNDLMLEDNVNIPDITSISVTPVMSEYAGEPLGLLEATLSEPYVFGDSPVYVGYSLTVDDAESEGAQYPVVVSKVSNPNGFFIHYEASSAIRWMDYSGQGSAVIVVTIEKEEMEAGLAILDYDPVYPLENEPFDMNFYVANIGNDPITSLTYTYSYDGGTAITEEYRLPEPIVPDLYSPAEISLKFEGSEGLGLHHLDVSIEKVNGLENPASTGSTVADVTVVAFYPKHRPLVEEYTGLWCGYCPKGYIAMETLNEEYPDEQVSICYHNKDKLTVTDTYPLNYGTYPYASIDREAVIDPYYGTYEKQELPLGIFDNIFARSEVTAFASVDVTAQVEENTVEIETNVIFSRDYSENPYLIGYVLTCDNLYNEYWYQLNYYSGMTKYNGTPLEVAQEWPKMVYGLVYNYIAVDVDGYLGVEGSLPESVKVNETYTHKFSYNIADNNLIPKPEDLTVTAFLVDPETRMVMNSNKYALKSNAGVSQSFSEAYPVSTVWYDLSGIRTDNPGKGIYICRQILSDGTTKTQKIINK